MNGLLFLILSVMILSTEASIPQGLRKFLGSGNVVDENSTHMSKMPGKAQFGEVEEPENKLSHMRTSIEEARKNYDSGDVSLYTPRPVKEAECYVEFQVPRREPGRCIKLAGITPACQTDTYLSPNHYMCS